MASKKCIDVYEGNGKVDWAKVKALGVDYAILKATVRTNVADSQFRNNVKGCRAQSIPFDVYKYSYATTETAVKKEVLAVVNLLKEVSYNKRTIWWDVEASCIRALGKTKITELIKIADKEVTKYGYNFAIYCGLDWYQNVLEVDKLDYTYWIARYPSTARTPFEEDPSDKYKPSIKHPMWGWQYTGTGIVDGVNGNCDITVMYTEEKKETPKEVPTVSDVDKIVSVAEKELGYLEKSSKAKYQASVGRSDEKTYGAGSSNWTKYGAWIGCNGDFWCASFVSWLFYKTFGYDQGKKILGTYSPACEDIRDKITKVTSPKKGDVIFFKGSRHAGANHIGLVVNVTSSYVYTIEGNTSGGSTVVDNGGGVARKCYDKGYSKILSYGRPKYPNAETVTPTPAPTPAKTTPDENGCPYPKPTKTLKYGMTDPGVQWMKWYLNKLMDAKILMATKLTPSNAYWGDTTSVTVKGFQTLYPTTGTNNKPDGEFGSKCVAKCLEVVKKLNAKKTYKEATGKSLPSKLPACGYYQLNDKSAEVQQIKEFLFWVYPNSMNVSDNNYGPLTVSHVKSFQAAHGINPSGCWNKSTQNAANSYKK